MVAMKRYEGAYFSRKLPVFRLRHRPNLENQTWWVCAVGNERRAPRRTDRDEFSVRRLGSFSQQAGLAG